MAALCNGVVTFSGKLLSTVSSAVLLQRRSYIGEPASDPPIEPRKYVISRDPEEWKYVTRLFQSPTVPSYTPKTNYPSGWIPPSEKGKTHPYFVERTKNHMLPLYLQHHDRGQLKITVIKKIHGDIWQLHDELNQHVKQMEGKKIPSQVLECNSSIKFKGDRFHWVEQFLLSKGF